MEISEKSIYELSLHELIKVKWSLYVTRVPGGWLYEGPDDTYATFVPFNNEFQDD